MARDSRAEAEDMSAPYSNSTDRELEALRRAQRAHEPSMEEILASIRSIIADDRANARTAEAKGAARPASSGPQIVYSKDAPAKPEPQESPLPRAEAPPADPGAPKVVWSQPAAPAEKTAAAPKPAPTATRPDEPPFAAK